jgi:hypothetical protein
VNNTVRTQLGRWLRCSPLLAPFGLCALTLVFAANTVLLGSSASLSTADKARLADLMSKRDKHCATAGLRGWEIQVGRQESPDALKLRRTAISRWLQARGVDPRDIHDHAYKDATLEHGINVAFHCTPS